MPHVDKVPMRSVVYVIIEDRENHEIYSSNSILIDAVQLSTRVLVYTVELLNKCGIHQAHQYVTVHDKDIFRTLEECKAVGEDRQKRLGDANKTSEDLKKQINKLLDQRDKRQEDVQNLYHEIEKMKICIQKCKSLHNQKEVLKKSDDPYVAGYNPKQTHRLDEHINKINNFNRNKNEKDKSSKSSGADSDESIGSADPTLPQNQYSRRKSVSEDKDLEHYKSINDELKKQEEKEIEDGLKMKKNTESYKHYPDRRIERQKKRDVEELEKQETINNANLTQPSLHETDTSRSRSGDEEIYMSSTDSDKPTGSAHSARPASPEPGHKQSGDDAVSEAGQRTKTVPANAQSVAHSTTRTLPQSANGYSAGRVNQPNSGGRGTERGKQPNSAGRGASRPAGQGAARGASRPEGQGAARGAWRPEGQGAARGASNWNAAYDTTNAYIV